MIILMGEILSSVIRYLTRCFLFVYFASNHGEQMHERQQWPFSLYFAMFALSKISEAPPKAFKELATVIVLQ